MGSNVREKAVFVFNDKVLFSISVLGIRSESNYMNHSFANTFVPGKWM